MGTTQDNPFQTLVDSASIDPKTKNNIGKIFQSLLSSVQNQGSSSTMEQDSVDAEAEHQRLLQQSQQSNPNINSVTGMHNDQIDALRGLLNKVDKAHAQDFLLQAGPQNARMMVDQHDALMQNMAQDFNTDGSSQSSGQSTSTASTPVAAQSSTPVAAPVSASSQTQPSVNPLALLHNLVQGMVDIIPTSPEAKLANSQVALNRIKMAAGLPSETLLPTAQAALAGTEAASKQAELTAGAPQANVALTKQQTATSAIDASNKQKELAVQLGTGMRAAKIQGQERAQAAMDQINKQIEMEYKSGNFFNKRDRINALKQQRDTIGRKAGLLPQSVDPAAVAEFIKRGLHKQ